MKTPLYNHKRVSRIEELCGFDIRHGNFIIGTDEVGRGPIAGPVVAAAVFFPEFTPQVKETVKYIDDSKKFSSSPALRKELSEAVKSVSKYSIKECSAEDIDRINILQASLKAMGMACQELLEECKKEDLIILVDGKFVIPHLKLEQKAIKKGDSLSASIAAASILAKVYRDELMTGLSEDFPRYGWQRNKGYPTKEHKQAVQKFGACKWHRKTFLS